MFGAFDVLSTVYIITQPAFVHHIREKINNMIVEIRGHFPSFPQQLEFAVISKIRLKTVLTNPIAKWIDKMNNKLRGKIALRSCHIDHKVI